jgi:cytochrome c
METFGQDTSSCMGCHAMSRTLNPSRFVSADFSFTLNNAQPRPAEALCGNVGASESCSNSIIPSPSGPKTDWDLENWQEILDGFATATHTFGLTRPSSIHSKLRCSSCHLNAGGNRDAAWWVDMQKVYDYPKTTRLQDRINGCFERSMNGEAICSTADGPEDCAKNPMMSSLITYMGWITEQFHGHYPNRQPCRGFPPFQVGGGDYARGQRIYKQKCSFCHNTEGQGRYESDTYLRPALWGPDSFNACAGMGRIETLGAFLRWNMPYTSGGMLTTLEANDLAIYIDAQCRPGKGGVGPSGEPCSLSPSPSCATPCACPEFKTMGSKP